METRTSGTLTELGGDGYRRWRTGPHRFTARTEAHFDVPGLETALAVSALPRDVRTLLETLRAGMVCVTEGERDGAGTLRRTFTMEATPDRPAMRCTTLETADGTCLYSRDGLRFGVLSGPVVSPGETEQALESIDGVTVADAAVEDGDDRLVVRGTLAAEQIAGLVDVRRLLGKEATAATQSGAVELTVGADAMELTLSVEVTADAAVAEGIGFRSTTRLHCTGVEGGGGITVPRTSLGLPGIARLDQAFRLNTPRGARATKKRRRK